MREAKPLLIALWFIVSMNGSAQGPAKQPTQDSSVKPDTCTVQGIVTATATRLPLKSAWVALTAVSAESSKEMTEDGLFKGITDDNGHFVIAGLPAGKYQFRAGKTGYVSEDYRLDGGPPEAALKLQPGEKLDKVEFRLPRTAVIMGRVTDESGEPIAGVVMEADAAGTRMGDWAPEDPLRYAVTNDLGEYRIHDLIPGGYYLSATDSGSSVFMNSMRLIWELGERYANHPPVYYPDATKSSEAQRIRLRTGEERRIDFSLRTVKLLTISGRLLDTTGKPAAQIKVRLRPQDPYSSPILDFRYGITPDAEGNFVIREVLPGSYVVSAILGEEEYWTEQRIDIAGDNVSGLVLQLRKELELSGRMSATGGSRFDFQKVRIWLEADRRDEPTYRGAWSEIQKDGTFAIHRVRPTTYRLGLYPMPDGWYLRSAFFGKQNVLDDGLDLSGPDSHESLELTFSPTAGRLEGVVLRGDDPAYGALVRLFPEPANPNYTGLSRDARTDQDGHFVIDSIVPGHYRAVAYASERTDGADGDSVSTSIIVAEKESKTLNLKLPKKEE